MPITRTSMVDDDGSGTTGTILNNAWKQELYGQIDGAIVPLDQDWQTVPFSAANYTADTGTWTVAAGAQIEYRWMAVNAHMVTILLRLTAAGAMSTSASTIWLYINMPAPIPAILAGSAGTLQYLYNGVAGSGLVQVVTPRKIGCLRDVVGTPWPVITNAGAYLYVQLTAAY